MIASGLASSTKRPAMAGTGGSFASGGSPGAPGSPVSSPKQICKGAPEEAMATLQWPQGPPPARGRQSRITDGSVEAERRLARGEREAPRRCTRRIRLGAREKWQLGARQQDYSNARCAAASVVGHVAPLIFCVDGFHWRSYRRSTTSATALNEVSTSACRRIRSPSGDSRNIDDG